MSNLSIQACLLCVLFAGETGLSWADEREHRPSVIEIVTFKLKPGVTYAEFQPFDHALQLRYVENQPGFLSRESAVGEAGEWLVVVHWRSTTEADASMRTFKAASQAQAFLSMIDLDTMSMKRYTRP